MRVVLDTNVIVSGLLSEAGPPAAVLALVESGVLKMGTSYALIDELMRVLVRPRIATRLRHESSARAAQLVGRATLLRPSERIAVLTSDPSDNHLLEAAIEFGADYVITGDQAVRALGSFRGTEILTPTEFIALVEATDGDA